jgi:oligopeptidase A
MFFNKRGIMRITQMPAFANIDLDSYVAHLDKMLNTNLDEIADILDGLHLDFVDGKENLPTWEKLMYPLDVISDKVEKFWAPLAHLHAVVNSPKLRKCYQECLPKLTSYESKIGQNKDLFLALQKISRDDLNSVQNKILDDAILDFKLSGVGLSNNDKKRFEEVQTELAELTNQFENNILDAVQDFTLHVKDASKLAGLPEYLLANSQELAQIKNLDGWLLNLEQPTFVGVITYAEDRELRQKFYEAYSTRASDVGPSANKFDNTNVMDKILALRSETAKLLGYENYAEVSIATKMADSVNHVNKFLQDLAKIAYPKAQAEFETLKKYAKDKLGIDEVMPWDIAFVSEKMLHELYDVSQEKLRPYFPLPRVLSGLFNIINKLYGVTLEKVENVEVWHKDVECFAVLSEDQSVCGYLYVDLFARENKRSGAWMDIMQSRYLRADGTMQLPIATLTCNFAKSAQDKIATLSHDEVQTLFHECGHCLHHVLTKVDYIAASGVHGVEWDAVELPSQFFENWCWDKDALALLSQHIDTHESLPYSVYTNLLNSKNFLSAMALVRQLEFSIFDFRIHEQYVQSDADFIMQTLKKVRSEVGVVPVANYNRFQNSFSHIFAGGYAAGYYSYKWAEVLSADAFAKFEENGIFNPKTGREFLRSILEVGGSKKAKIAFKDFRGRDPDIKALLRQTGITSDQS